MSWRHFYGNGPSPVADPPGFYSDDYGSLSIKESESVRCSQDEKTLHHGACPRIGPAPQAHSVDLEALRPDRGGCPIGMVLAPLV